MKKQLYPKTLMKLFKKVMNNLLVQSFTVFIFSVIPSYSQSLDRLYQEGRTAYNSGDYIKAYKNLYSYKIIMQDQISSIVEKPINDAIKDCESELYSALTTKRNLERSGKVKNVTIESEGTMDKATATSIPLPSFKGDYFQLSECIEKSKKIEELMTKIQDLEDQKKEFIAMMRSYRNLQVKYNEINIQFREISKRYRILQNKYNELEIQSQ